jgi:2-desacetyl-2-hydroxyethyl bacteriochlorophyllide A dehydrogenase
MKITAVEMTGPRQMHLVEDVLPEPGDGQVELRSLYSAISHGTEMNVYRGVAPMWSMQRDAKTGLFLPSDQPQWHYPMRYGYACVAEVSKLGANVGNLQKGDRVFCYVPPQTAHVLPAGAVIKLPANVAPDEGIFLANINTTFNGILDADLHPQECVVVFGQGVLGQLAVQWAKMQAASPVIAVDMIDRRLQIAKSVSGADLTMNPAQVEDIALAVHKLTDNRGADAVFELSASDRALNEAIRTVCYNGKVMVMSWYAGALPNVYLGREFHHNRVQLICSQVGNIRPELSHRWSVARRMQAALALMPRLRLKELITQTVNYREAASAYELVDQHPEEVLQVVLCYD